MLNLLFFLVSCALTAGFSCYFLHLGKSPLTAWIVMLSLLANIFVLKQIELLSLNATASDVFAIGHLLGLNLLQEKFDRQTAEKAIWTSFGCSLFFSLISQIHLHYIPSPHDQSQAAYEFLLNPAPRIMLSSLATFLIVDQFDNRLYRTLRNKFPQLSTLFISGITISLSQLLDTILISFLGLYGIVEAIVEIIIFSYCVKLIAIANTIPWSFITRRFFNP